MQVSVSLPAPVGWLWAIIETTLGVILVWVVTRSIPQGEPLLRGWVAMLGLILFVHFGTFQIVALLWQSVRVDAQAIMSAPLRSTSLGNHCITATVVVKSRYCVLGFCILDRLGKSTMLPTSVYGLVNTPVCLELSRRDYVFIYTGDVLAATVKGRAFFDLYTDPREHDAKMLPMFREGFEESCSAPEECLVLSHAERGGGRVAFAFDATVSPTPPLLMDLLLSTPKVESSEAVIQNLVVKDNPGDGIVAHIDCTRRDGLIHQQTDAPSLNHQVHQHQSPAPECLQDDSGWVSSIFDYCRLTGRRLNGQPLVVKDKDILLARSLYGNDVGTCGIE